MATNSRTYFNPERFNQDYAIGKLGENAFKEQSIIWDMTIIEETPQAVFPDFDFKMQYQGLAGKGRDDVILPDPVTWEIKCDMGKTGNVPVQFHSSSKQQTQAQLAGMSCNAGIYRTKADLIAIFNPHDSLFYIAPIHMLKDLVENSPQIKKVKANKHKAEQTGIALVPKAVWKDKLYILSYYADEYTEIST